MNSYFKPVRTGVIIGLCAVFLIWIYIKFVLLSVSPQKKIAVDQTHVERGSIVDRNGKPLAVSANFYHFVITPKNIKSPEDFAKLIAHSIEMDEDEIVNIIKANENSNFVYLKRKLTQNQYDDVSEIILGTIYANACRFDKLSGRIYPENSLASQLVGFMGDDGKGLSGIEYSQQDILSPEADEASKSTVRGDNIFLTIDSNLQFNLEKTARKALEETQAESLMMIVCDAKSGEILTYISLPSANLNNYGESSNIQRLDRPSVTAYEPGSVFKIFSTAAFLDSASVSANDSFLCDGLYSKRTNLGELIRITCLDHHGWLNIRSALQYSCNDAIAQMSDKIDTEEFLEYIRNFGFGEKTGVELPSETRGIVKSTSDKYWSGRSKATMSIGQELSVSALQMVQAASVFANGGAKLKLTFIHRITDNEGNDKYVHTPQFTKQVISADTADYILSCMETTAQKGTGSRASLKDISIGVKTGTAQMADQIKGGYSETDFLSNCIAIFPIEEPEIILYIVIEKAKGETYAGRIVAPVIAQAADEIIDQLGMNREAAPSLIHSGVSSFKNNSPILIDKTVPNFIGRPKRDLVPLLSNPNINFNIKGEGWVISQNPPPGTSVTEDMIIELTLE